MPGPTVAAGPSMNVGALRTEGFETYTKRYTASVQKLQEFVQMDIASDDRENRYFYWESAPTLRFQEYGAPVAHRAFAGVRYDRANFIFSVAVDWLKWDEADDQTKQLVPRVREVASQAGALPEQLTFQQLQQSSDRNLMPDLASGPDGSALFITTARFGHTSGNELTGSGATLLNIQSDYYSALETFGSWKDTEDEPLFTDDVVDGQMLVIASRSNRKAFDEALLTRRFIGDAAGATPTNPLHDGDAADPRIWYTQRLSGNDWYIAATASPQKPLYTQTRERLDLQFATEANSDEARERGVKAAYAELRGSAGLHLPYAVLYVNQP